MIRSYILSSIFLSEPSGSLLKSSGVLLPLSLLQQICSDGGDILPCSLGSTNGGPFGFLLGDLISIWSSVPTSTVLSSKLLLTGLSFPLAPFTRTRWDYQVEQKRPCQQLLNPTDRVP